MALAVLAPIILVYYIPKRFIPPVSRAVWGSPTLEEGLIGSFQEKSLVEEIPPESRTVPEWVVIGAREEVRRGTVYDASYSRIEYPGGDVPSGRGACTDVVVRAFRKAGIDLQVLIHEDMKDHFADYPQLWGLNGPDSNIDHRRVPNQMRFLARHGVSLTLSLSPENVHEWHWGDIVYWKFTNGMLHTGVVSDRVGRSGLPLVIHNAGIAAEEDCLARWEVIGHFRYTP